MMQKQLEGGSGYLENRDAGNFFVAGRLKPGVTMARAEAGLNSVARGLAQQYPKDDDGMKIVLTPPGLGWKLHSRRSDRIRRGVVRCLLPGPAGGLHQPGEHTDGARGRPAQRDRTAPGGGRGARLAGAAIVDREPGHRHSGRRRRRVAGALDYRCAGRMASAHRYSAGDQRGAGWARVSVRADGFRR